MISLRGGYINFDGTQLNNLAITLPDVTLTIITSASNTLTTETSGASITMSNIPDFDGGDDANFDHGGPLSAASEELAVDFSNFNNLAAGEPGVVNTCVNPDNFCGLLPALSLDGYRYTLEEHLQLMVVIHILFVYKLLTNLIMR